MIVLARRVQSTFYRNITPPMPTPKRELSGRSLCSNHLDFTWTFLRGLELTVGSVFYPQCIFLLAKIVFFYVTSKYSQKNPPHDSLALGFAAYMSAASLKNGAADKLSNPFNTNLLSVNTTS